ncbi:hypothetical protein H6776_01795 [Candidatus Nomurabacteria bacterium]|nr:hypothetical protein [Candidatus Nomurabacteria bacterium]
MKGSTLTLTITIIIIAGAILAGVLVGNRPSIYEDFAECIADSGATFYGAFWCPHCLDQKSMFGKAADSLPYVECSLPDRSGQTEECTEAGITGYPTWDYQGDRFSGTLSLEVLAALTQCELPPEHVSSIEVTQEDLEQMKQNPEETSQAIETEPQNTISVTGSNTVSIGDVNLTISE